MFNKREHIVIFFLIIVIVGLIGYNIVIDDKIKISNDSSYGKDTFEKPELEYNNEIENNTTEESKIMVDISGEVHNPGVIVLDIDSRLIDAINAAGGLTEKADIKRINRAKKINDEEKINIPSIDDRNKISQDTELTTDGWNDSIETNVRKININIASITELMELPGIGEVKAKRIVEYRNENGFKNIEDIQNVNGIGQKIYEGIKDMITVN
ncbi:ComEA family DNA-binding protein [Clostridiisalibacter paucivorans]|uniref:ComEA family DNA-binding protein n=1 Tax=Clostridiisalibacter paucivorans TaxID=408753 RepID=UPI000556A915|nr:ComEA family DNA-binding protein [Clostridiisalibacter paucivorans]